MELAVVRKPRLALLDMDLNGTGFLTIIEWLREGTGVRSDKTLSHAANDNCKPTTNDIQPTRSVVMFLVLASLILIVGLVKSV
jgi:hypothetical protein